MRLSSYLQSAEEIVNQYRGEMPFASWLKAYFREHKKFGSRDRKLVADLCFCYFRLGKAFSNKETEERLLIGQFLCREESIFINELKPEWKDYSAESKKKKIAFLDAGQLHRIFPFESQLSNEIEKEDFQLSFLQQPDLFLRIRPGNENAVTQKLNAAGVTFSMETVCIRLSNSTKIDELISLDEEAVVQDISSQKVLQPLQETLKASSFSAWDCCAASGGKTILLHDAYPAARLTVSDIRESIIINLRNRLKRAGIHSYKSFVADVASPQFSLPQKFDVIICDAPCSGSGTWSRTPEQLYFFLPEKINQYAALQKSIALNASTSLKKGGYLLYITCSVFVQENEDVVQYLQEKGLQPLSQQYFTAYHQKGDTLFAALFTTS